MIHFETIRRAGVSAFVLFLTLPMIGCTDEPISPVQDAGADAAMPECLVASDCPGTDSDCQTRTCTSGICGISFVPAKTAVAAQVPGDCHVLVCDGQGAAVSEIDNTDLLPVEGPCSVPTCENGTPIYAYKKDGIACDDGDPCSVLDHCESGKCIDSGPLECAANAMCSAGVCAASQCTGATWFGEPPLAELSFEPSTDEPFRLAPGDFNGDGAVDLAVLNGSHIDLLFGDGRGNFSVGMTLSAVTNPTAVAAVDVNMDGHVDLAIATSTMLWILTNGGNGNFSSGVSYAQGAGTKEIVVADLNNDTKPDLATLHAGGASIFLNQNGGTFAPEISVAIGPETGGLAIGDINGDSRPDLVASYHLDLDNRVKIIWNQGNGSFLAGNDYFSHGLGPASSVALMDLDANGRLDILSTTLDGTSTFLNDGNGMFVAGPLPGELRGFRSIVTNLDNMGTRVAIAYWGTSHVTVATKIAGIANFVYAHLDNLGARDVAAVDVNGDAATDIVLGNSFYDRVEVLLNDGTGQFLQPPKFAAGPPTFPGSEPGAFVVRDFDGNGKPDVAITNVDRNDVTILLHTGQGKLDGQTNYSYPVGLRPVAIAAADLNGDGRDDLVVENEGDENLVVLLNQGNGKFYISAPYVLGLTPESMILADMNKDLRPDIFVMSISKSVVLENLGDGTFGAPVAVGKGIYADLLVTADFNGDGLSDIVGAHRYQTDVWLMAGQPDGKLLDPVKYEVPAFIQGIVTTDIDNDKRPDVVVSGTAMWVFRNAGDGTFAPSVETVLPWSAASVVAQDVDMDGDEDIVAAKYLGPAVMLLLNSGSTTLQYAGSFYSRMPLHGIDGADMNADGRSDLVVLGTDGDENAEVRILWNMCQP